MHFKQLSFQLAKLGPQSENVIVIPGSSVFLSVWIPSAFLQGSHHEYQVCIISAWPIDAFM